MPAYLSNAIARVCGDAVAESLLSVANGYDPLTVTIPCNIIDPSRYEMVFALCVICPLGIPHPHRAGYISTCNVEA